MGGPKGDQNMEYPISNKKFQLWQFCCCCFLQNYYKIIFRDFEAANVSIKSVTYISALWRARDNRPSRFLLKSVSDDSPF